MTASMRPLKSDDMANSDEGRNWRDDLLKRYHNLFVAPHEDLSTASGYPTVDDGWCDLLEKACARIAQALSREPGGVVRVRQIKEKFGTLRFYYGTKNLSDQTKKAVELAVDLAEARSKCTCEVCGNEGDLYDKDGYIMTRCPDHAEGDPVRSPPGWKYLTVVHVYSGDKVVLQCRRYDRATDSLVEVGPRDVSDLEE
jgi:hypothetical protein